MDDLILPLMIVLLFIILVVIILFYRQISKANHEYEEVKSVAGDITIGFGRKMRKLENGISLVAERVDRLSSEVENVLRKMDEHERRLVDITSKTEKVLQSRSKMKAEVEAIEEKIRQAVSRQEMINQKIDKLEKTRFERARTRPKRKIVTPIPIKRERALAPLTESQLKILEILATEGEKTASEMKDKIGITREHTARLMRRLYDEGYVERDMRKMPYVYRIKEEAREIIKG